MMSEKCKAQPAYPSTLPPGEPPFKVFVSAGPRAKGSAAKESLMLAGKTDSTSTENKEIRQSKTGITSTKKHECKSKQRKKS